LRVAGKGSLAGIDGAGRGTVLLILLVLTTFSRRFRDASRPVEGKRREKTTLESRFALKADFRAPKNAPVKRRRLIT